VAATIICFLGVCVFLVILGVGEGGGRRNPESANGQSQQVILGDDIGPGSFDTTTEAQYTTHRSDGGQTAPGVINTSFRTNSSPSPEELVTSAWQSLINSDHRGVMRTASRL